MEAVADMEMAYQGRREAEIAEVRRVLFGLAMKDAVPAILAGSGA